MKTILVIEDEVKISNNISEILLLSDFNPLVANNGLEGLQLAQSQLPDLIICDLMMPDVDGYQVLSQLRHNTTTATIPFIFLTAKSEWCDVRKGMQRGADDYLIKPFSPGELLRAIDARLYMANIRGEQSQ